MFIEVSMGLLLKGEQKKPYMFNFNFVIYRFLSIRIHSINNTTNKLQTVWRKFQVRQPNLELKVNDTKGFSSDLFMV